MKTEEKDNHLQAKEISFRKKMNFIKTLIINFYCLSCLVYVFCYSSPKKLIQHNIIEITHSIQSATSKYFVIINLATIFYSVSISTGSQPVFLHLQKNTILLNYVTYGHLCRFVMAHHLYRQDLSCTHLSPGTYVQLYVYDIIFQMISLNIFIKDIPVQHF